MVVRDGGKRLGAVQCWVLDSDGRLAGLSDGKLVQTQREERKGKERSFVTLLH